jgi:hypothetical protein
VAVRVQGEGGAGEVQGEREGLGDRKEREGLGLIGGGNMYACVNPNLSE